MTAKGVDDSSNRWRGSLADEVKVKHALYSSRLQTTLAMLAESREVAPEITILDEASGLVVKQATESAGTQRSARSGETRNVVVARVCVCAGRVGGSAVRGWYGGRHGYRERGESDGEKLFREAKAMSARIRRSKSVEG